MTKKQLKQFTSQPNWVFPQDVTLPESFLTGLNCPDIVRKAMWLRGINNPVKAQRFLDWRLYQSTSPYDLPDMEKAVERILYAVNHKQRIGIWGDFDVDGQTSTAVLVDTFRSLNVPVQYRIPVRAVESHGIKLEPLKRFLSNEIDVLITCDTGITETLSIDYAQSRGVDVIVTDHHALPQVLPDALALINPRRLDETHPLAALAGVGTAFKLAEAILSKKNMQEKIVPLHDLVALGTIADLAILVDENRFLVQSGIDRIRCSPRPALKSLLDFSGVSNLMVTESQLGYLVAPRLNALGRLGDANPAVDYLLSSIPAEIEQMTYHLEELNSSRKIQCDQVFSGAMAMIEQNRSIVENPAIILVHTEWPGGVVGITASRLVELFHKPVLILVKDENGILKGSGRSVDGVDISAILHENHQYLSNFGGHPMAAGLSLTEEQFPLFSQAFQHSVEGRVKNQKISNELKIDLLTPLSTLTIDQVKMLDMLAPFGPGNPPLLCCEQGLSLVSSIPIGKNADHLKITVEDEHANQSTLLWWNGGGMPLPREKFDLAYTVHSSSYKGAEQVQFEWVDFRESIPQVPEIRTSLRHTIRNIDLRDSGSPLEMVNPYLDQPGVEIWREGFLTKLPEGHNRLELETSNVLVIWTTPCDPTVTKRTIQKVKPKEIVWVLQNPTERDATIFLKSLWSLVSELMTSGKELTHGDAYSQLACSDDQLVLGLRWLSAAGKLSIRDESPLSILPIREGVRDEQLKHQIEKELLRSLAETKAYASYLMKADLNRLAEEIG